MSQHKSYGITIIPISEMSPFNIPTIDDSKVLHIMKTLNGFQCIIQKLRGIVCTTQLIAGTVAFGYGLLYH